MRSRLKERKEPKKHHNKPLSKLVLALGILLLVVGTLYLIFNRYWDGKSKISIAVTKDDGSAAVVIVDPPASTLTTINIPKNTLVKASHELGEWRLESIWKLGINEKLGPDFFLKTITKSFKFPVEAWANEKFLGLTENNLQQKVYAIFSPGISNLTIIDRLQIAWFSIFVKNTAKQEIALEETGYIKSAKLADSSKGWIIGETVPLSIASLFVNHDLENLNVEVIDASRKNAGREVNGVLNTLGIKVAVITKKDVPEKDCTIITKNTSAGLRLSRVFGCSYKNMPTNDNFDVKLILTSEFSQLF